MRYNPYTRDGELKKELEEVLKRQKDFIEWTLLIIIYIWLIYFVITTIMKKRR
jgi:hypothetical protein